MEAITLNPLNTALVDANSSGRVRFHIPGHQGRQLFPSAIDEPIRLDSTELDGLDDLTNPDGCLKDALAQAAELYGVAHSFFLTQGSTVGIQAGMLALFQPGETILVPRNGHRAVIHGMALVDAQPAWIMPGYNDNWGTWLGLTVADIQHAHTQHPEATGLILPNPTYDGWATEIEAIGEYCKTHQLKLLVDEAHGSLWPLSSQLPTSACELPKDFAADVVVQSLHKSAGAITPAAMAHLPYGSMCEKARFQQCLNVLHTSSPSYPLLANMEACCHWLASEPARKRLDSLLNDLSELSLPQPFVRCNALNHDPMALLVKHPTRLPEDWATQLESDLNVSYEALNTVSALYKVGIGAITDDFHRFSQALATINQGSVAPSSPDCPPNSRVFAPASLPEPMVALSPRQALFAQSEQVSKNTAIGRVSLTTIAPCPPGVPLILPGEVIQAAHLPYLPKDITVQC